MKRILFAILFVFCAFISTVASQTYGSIRNKTFSSTRQYKPEDPEIVNAKNKGWKIPDNLVLPQWWVPNPATGKEPSIEYLRGAGFKGSAYIKLDGSGHLSSYFGGLEPAKPYIATIQVRGKGEVKFGAYCYAEKFVDSIPFINQQIDTNKWIEYRGIFANDREDVKSINLYLEGKGPVDIGEIDFLPASSADVEIIKEYVKLYGTGGLIEDIETEAVVVDEAFRKKLGDYTAIVKVFKEAKRKGILLFSPLPEQNKMDSTLYESLEEKIGKLEPYIMGEDKKLILSSSYNDMVVLTRVLGRLLGSPVADISKADVKTAETEQEYYPLGYREPVLGKLTITDVRSNKVRYDENEKAITTAKISNMTDTEQKGTLIALMRIDIDTMREITRTLFTIPKGQTKEWKFSYNVGPETYGRAIEVQFVDVEGKVIDSWQEYYVVASEWFRVQHHAYQGQMKTYKVDPFTTYFNQRHDFASEPTDWGVQAEWCAELEQYYSSQPLYHLNMPARRATYAWFKNQGVMGTFYQTFGYAGQMGYEVIRQHPEFSLYDSNGQFAVDPVYGGSPNPIELASPIEIGSKRKVVKPYLDRRITSWQHNVVNYAMEDVIIFMAESIKKHAAFLNCDGIYIDGNLGVWKGYGYDGKLNVPSGKYEDIVALNARNHNLFSEMLKKDNPNFGTWFNWAWGAVEYYLKQRGLTFYMGSGGDEVVDPLDDSVRAAAGWKNVMFLMEWQSGVMRPPYREPEEVFDALLTNRDYIVQKHGANAVTGYMFAPLTDASGLTKWGWPTMNYWGAQLIASQHHFAGGFYPSMHPSLQFQTRYSRLIWAPDVKSISEKEVEKMIKIGSSEELWWKRIVYRRDNADSYDLIIHLVRIPPYEKFDIEWLEEPKILSNTIISIALPDGEIKGAYSARPYFYGEKQQVVEKSLTPTVVGGKAVLDIPPFRYHTMVVLRVKE